MSILQKTIDDITRTKLLLDQSERIPGRDNLGDFKITFSNLQASLTNVPVGTIIESMAIATPAGYLYADGDSYLRADYPGLFAAITADKGAVTISMASPGVVTLNTHGLITGDCVSLTTTGALYTGLTASTNYFVIYNDANSFWLATTWANAQAGTKINTSGSQSGVHTLLFNPHGIADSTHFNIPDCRGVFMRGDGASGILSDANAAAFNGGNIGTRKNDKFQDWQLGATADNTGTRTYYACADLRDQGHVPTGYATASTYLMRTDLQGIASRLKPLSNGTNGTPRTGSETAPASITTKRYIKY